MRIINIKTIFLFVGLGLIASCGSGGDSPAEPEVKLPEKSILALPVNGETCSAFGVIANDDTKAEINFSWGAASHADSYILKITQAGNLVVNQTLSTTTHKAILDKGKTYSWTITAKNTDGENLSTTHSFTTPGKPIGNYVPYAAVINFNINSSTSMASLSWIGKDEDSNTNELKYDISIKEDNVSKVSLTNQTQTSLADFAVKLNSTYQIKINTIDKHGSYSSSVLNYTYE
ncbi:hypothetical protein [Flavobacterium sp. GSA192]|uniref:hypothetical protein n=1 Tax=Flavobacterium sp. GSA192 TaxID=2576304 RepID=UPI001129A478|nr:hypothetical protein [Flavobacterium sp. GSA192]